MSKHKEIQIPFPRTLNLRSQILKICENVTKNVRMLPDGNCPLSMPYSRVENYGVKIRKKFVKYLKVCHDHGGPNFPNS